MSDLRIERIMKIGDSVACPQAEQAKRMRRYHALRAQCVLWQAAVVNEESFMRNVRPECYTYGYSECQVNEKGDSYFKSDCYIFYRTLFSPKSILGYSQI